MKLRIYTALFLSLLLSAAVCSSSANQTTNQQASGPASGELRFKAPAGWVTEKTTSAMRVAQYKLPKSEIDLQEAALAPCDFGAAQGGSGQANIEKKVAAQTIITQQRINRYFHATVIPKLKNCWAEIEKGNEKGIGKGTIAFEYTFTRSKGRWVSPKLSVTNSTLSRARNALASRCMTAAIKNTSFARTNNDGKENSFSINWTWPVPFPGDFARLTRAMFAARTLGTGGDLGCDGFGTPPSCQTCVFEGNNIVCKKVCVGYKICTEETPDLCRQRVDCASGGPFKLGSVILQ
ncbi:MAG TPA: hypothetical protein VFX97_13915 [Pyrinomonadaceae bacterium]|nr:hypothetical protein [Pyrinomonadaceae bacterium]